MDAKTAAAAKAITEQIAALRDKSLRSTPAQRIKIQARITKLQAKRAELLQGL